MSAKKLFHEQVADKLIEQLAAGVAPWQKPWTPGGSSSSLPVNATTGKRYHGANVVQLMAQGYDDPRWCTYRQAAAAGAQVRAGERGTTVQYFKFTEEQTKRDEQGRPVLDAEGKPVKEDVRLERPRCFHSSVFNAQQIDGLKPLPPLAPSPEQQWSPSERAEHILAASGAQIKHGQQDQAFYRPATDTIHLPEQSQFPEANGYYATALHELGHWTGHESRLDRPLNSPFGSEGYAKEELRAEIASMIVGETIGIGHDPADHAAYVGHWIKSLRDDPMEIVRAAGDAEKISNYVMAFEQQQVQTQEPVQDQGQEWRPELLIQQVIDWQAADVRITAAPINEALREGRPDRAIELLEQMPVPRDELPQGTDELRNAIAENWRQWREANGVGPSVTPEDKRTFESIPKDLSQVPVAPQPVPIAAVPPQQIVLMNDGGGYFTGVQIEPWTDDARDARVYQDPAQAQAAADLLRKRADPLLNGPAIELHVRDPENPRVTVPLSAQSSDPQRPAQEPAQVPRDERQIVLGTDSGNYYTGSSIEPWTDDASDAQVYADPSEAWRAALALQAQQAEYLEDRAVELHLRETEDSRAGRLVVSLADANNRPKLAAQWQANFGEPLPTDLATTQQTESPEPNGWVTVAEEPTGKWSWSYMDSNGVEVASGEGYESEEEARADGDKELEAQTAPEQPSEQTAATAKTSDQVPSIGGVVETLAQGAFAAMTADTVGGRIAAHIKAQAAAARAEAADRARGAGAGPSFDSNALSSGQPNAPTPIQGAEEQAREQEGREDRTYIQVPYQQKDEAKALGARWDRAAASWYVPPGWDLSQFEKWPTVAGATAPGVAATPTVAAERETPAAPESHMLRLAEFMAHSRAVPLKNDEDKWYVTYGSVETFGEYEGVFSRHFSSDADTADDAKREAHASEIEAALRQIRSVANGGLSGGVMTMPPDAVIDDHPGMREKWADVCGEKVVTNPVEDSAPVTETVEPLQSQSAGVLDEAIVSHRAESQETPPAPAQTPAAAARQYLAVPYEERGPAKAAGAKWDAGAKSWYVGPNADMEKLERWNPERVKAQQDPAIPPREEFAEALRQIGCVVSGEHPIMDGAMHRITVVGEAHSDKAGSGFYVGHLDGHPAGYMKNNKSGVEMKWKSAGQVMDPEARAALAAAAATKLQERAVEQAETHESTAQRLATQLRSLQPVTAPTPYMQAKGIDPQPGVYTDKSGRGTCIPVVDANGKQWSTQYIQEDGTKRFAKDSKKEGFFHVVGGDLAALERAPAIVIGEGYATAATLTAAVGFPAVAAFDSGNLPAVAQALHEKMPGKPIIVAADDDLEQQRTRGRNPGREKAEQAAKAVGGHVLLPIFAAGEQEGNPKAFSDFNDMANNSVLGIEGVQRQARTMVDAVVEREQTRTQEREQVQQQEQKRVSKRVAKIG